MSSQEHESRVLVFAPTGRDGSLICNLLVSKSISCVLLSTAEKARIELKNGAGALILAEEGLTVSDIATWAEEITEQPSWSDFPIILLTVSGEVDRESQRKARLREPLGNLVLLERPVRPETFVSTVQAALRSRRRQYQMRDYLADSRKVEEEFRKTEKLAVAGRLAASISHEINNPLESVTNLLYLIGTSTSQKESKKYSEIAANELARVSEIVAQTLRSYREPAKPAMVHITEVVDSALTLYRARLTYANIVIERKSEKCSPILAVQGELRQVILNLIGNAMDAMKRGGTLKIRTTNTHERINGARPGIRLTIADTGLGIQPEIRKTLFEPFVSTKGNTGTGLGLWISSEIIRKHCGNIRVRSSILAPSNGTVFSVFLPLAPPSVPSTVLKERAPVEALFENNLSGSPRARALMTQP